MSFDEFYGKLSKGKDIFLHDISHPKGTPISNMRAIEESAILDIYQEGDIENVLEGITVNNLDRYTPPCDTVETSKRQDYGEPTCSKTTPQVDEDEIMDVTYTNLPDDMLI